MSVSYLLTYFVTKVGFIRMLTGGRMRFLYRSVDSLQWLPNWRCLSVFLPQPLTVYKPRGRDWIVWAALPCRTGSFWAQSPADLVQCADSHSCCEPQCAREGHPCRQALTTCYWRCVQSLPPDATLMDIRFLLWDEDEAKKITALNWYY